MKLPAGAARILAAVAGVTLLAIVNAHCSLVRPEIKVTVTNSQEELMRDVTVRVTGAQYELGDLVSESSASVIVKPTGESSAFISYRDIDDRVIDIDAGTYMEPGYRGTIALTVYPGGDSKLVVNVKP